jgi:hypothetical protein
MVLVAALVGASLALAKPGAETVAMRDPGLTVAAPAGATATPPGSPTPAPPSSRAIYKGHTLEEIVADPELLAEVNALSDYIRPVHGEPDPPLPNFGSDTICPNHVECP